MPKENELSAYRFHADLFLSGLERIILVSNKLARLPSLRLPSSLSRSPEKHQRPTTRTCTSSSRDTSPTPREQATSCPTPSRDSSASRPPHTRRTPSPRTQIHHRLVVLGLWVPMGHQARLLRGGAPHERPLRPRRGAVCKYSLLAPLVLVGRGMAWAWACPRCLRRERSSR